ncbi:MAG: CDP-glycerol glycerophosphotransferase family protein [Lachnospiraceae bacterium]|nr:CDP-glycerol glycerophosphotransferase family protein [Lachnospiraceae bacterium]
MGQGKIKAISAARWFIKRAVLAVYHMLAAVLPVRRDIIVFESNLGRNYTGNPRYIYEEMVQQGLDKQYRIYYIFDRPEEIVLPGSAVKLKNFRLRFYYVMAAAGIWISDTRLPNYMKKRKETVYIQTWHGTPLKKLALDMEEIHMEKENSLQAYKEEFRKNTATWDYLLAQSPFAAQTFRKAFDFKGTMLMCGYPRNDRLFAWNNEERIRELKEKHGIPQGKKVMLYAPTWRDDAFYGNGQYKFETELNFDAMQEAFGGEWVLLVKYHYLVEDKLDFGPWKGFVYPFRKECDIAELYLTADILITDYSSVMFDYSILRRPMFFYTYDLDYYRGILRGFYFDFEEEAPGPIVQTTEALIQAIASYQEEEWKEKAEAFREKYNTADNGTASEQIVELVASICCGRGKRGGRPE